MVKRTTGLPFVADSQGCKPANSGNVTINAEQVSRLSRKDRSAEIVALLWPRFYHSPRHFEKIGKLAARSLAMGTISVP
jgi:hypothetical protein